MAPAATKTSKKRSAPSQAAGRKPKKVQLEKPADSDVKGKKRSRPITLPVAAVEEDEDADSSDEVEGLEDAEDEELAGEGAEGEAGAPSQSTDLKTARQSHKDQKVLQDQRRAAKPHSAVLTEAKHAWSLARQKNLSKADRTANIAALMRIIRGKVKDIVFKHDASRIVQTVVKYGGPKDRNEVAVELKGRYKELAQNKYSKFLVTKLIRLCPTHRASILSEFHGSILRLLLHREASSVLADAFELYANAYERALLLRDFYGKEAKLVSLTAGSDEEKESTKKGLRGLLEGKDGERRKRVMGAVKDNLVSIFNNSDKGAVSHAIVHRVLWEYLTAVNEMEEAEAEKLRREMFETCEDVLAEIVHTKDGSRVVREFIARGTAKDRKVIVKALKPHVVRMCGDDEAQLVLFSALDIIDDTKLVSKSLIADITTSASALSTTPQGRRSLIYLVSPRTRRHFTPAQIALLSETDALRATTSKKDPEVRQAEIRQAASAGLLEWVAKDGPGVARDPGGSLVVGEVMLYAEGDKSAASTALLTALAAPYPSPDPADPHPITLPHVSRLYKMLLQGGPFSHHTHEITRSPFFSPLSFAATFVEVVGRENTRAMARDDGAFVVAVLCERALDQESADGDTEEKEKREQLKKTLEEWFDETTREGLESESERRGRSILLEQLKALSLS